MPALPRLPQKFTVVELIDALGGPSVVARICGFDKNAHARGGDLRRRQSIAVNHWAAMIEAARKLGHAHVTFETINAAHEMGKAKPKKLSHPKKRSSLL